MPNAPRSPQAHPRARPLSSPAVVVLGVLVAAGVLGADPAAAGAVDGSVVACGLPEEAQPRVDRVADQLTTDPVLLDDRAVRLAADQADQVRDAVRRSPEPLWVAALADLPDTAEPRAVACALANAAPMTVSVVVLLGPDRLPALGADTTVGADPDVAEPVYLAADADQDETGSEAERLVLLVDRVSGRAPIPSDQGPSGTGPTVQEPDATTRSGRGLLLGLGVVVVGLVAAVAVLRLVRRHRAGRRARRLLASVRHGRATGAEIATRREVHDLGDRLDHLEIGPRDDVGAWQRALDAYQSASRGLDRAGGRADLEGVRRLCEQAQDELDAVERARSEGGS